MQNSGSTAMNGGSGLRRVLLVDDDPRFLRQIGRNLAKSGFIVETAPDGFSGRDILQTEVFDVVVSDFKMPGLDGLGLLDFVRKLPNSPKFLLLTGCGSPEVTVDALAHGADQYVEKPVDGPLLARKINALFQRDVSASRPAVLREVVTEVPEDRPQRDRTSELEASWDLEPVNTILVLDDDLPTRMLMGRLLQRFGYEADECGDAELALELAAARPFSAVVSDISMPGMDGLEFLRNLRKRNIEIPVVFVTGLPSLKTAISALELGASGYLTKPLDNQVGRYEFSLTVTDDNERTNCDPASVVVTVTPSTDVYIELVAGGGAVSGPDGPPLELHFVQPGGTWNDFPTDCTVQNRTPDWGESALDTDDPVLDLPGVASQVPTTIRLDQPEEGVYQIGVLCTAEEGTPCPSLLRVYLNGESPVELETDQLEALQFWDAGRIRWTEGSVSSIDRILMNGIP